jgi:lipopolysaccharide export LptBFGC system permease protein LptF
LSITTKAKARKDRKEGKKDEPDSATPKKKDVEDSEKKDTEMKDVNGEEQKKEEEKKDDEPEPEFQELKNPTRVLKQQETKISYQSECRYMPVLSTRFGGFVILKEVNPLGEDEVEEYYDDEERDADAPNPDL